MSTLIGRVGIVDRGEWSALTTDYSAMDMVRYNNSIYTAKQAVPTGTLPTNTTYWELSLDASLLQPKTMSSPVTIGGEAKTTVEAAVGALEDVKADKTAISSVETTSTAASAHAVGSYFINASGQFVKTTNAIAVGDTISGSNTAVSSIEEAKASKSDLTSIIATGATNTTGAKISVGTYFYLNGTLCRAISDIAVNATFTENTNYVETTVGDEVADTGWIPLSSPLSGASAYFRRFGNMVAVHINIPKNVMTGNWQDIASLPAGFRPSKELYNNCFYDGSNWMTAAVVTSGSVQVKGSSSYALDAELVFFRA